MAAKLILFVSIIFTTFSFNEIEIPEQKIAREVDKVYGISDFDLEIQEELSIKCIGQEQYSKQINITQNGTFLGNVFIRRVHTCDPNACSDPTLTPSHELEDLEFFDYFIILDKDAIIKNITVYNYQATHGHEVAKRSWLSQFVEKQTQALIYEENIDAISGATISAQNFTFEIDYLLDCFRTN